MPNNEIAFKRIKELDKIKEKEFEDWVKRSMLVCQSEIDCLTKHLDEANKQFFLYSNVTLDDVIINKRSYDKSIVHGDGERYFNFELKSEYESK